MLLQVTIILLTIWLIPIICRLIRVPSIVGLIIAGMLLGPHTLNVIEYDTNIQTLGQLGMIYLMFLSGIEIDITDFKRNRLNAVILGLLTFIIPAVIGTLFAQVLLNLKWSTAILLGSMLGSHTIMTYPIVSRYGIAKNKAVNVAVGATIFAIAFSLLLLAAFTAKQGDNIDSNFLLRLGAYSTLFLLLVVGLFPKLATAFIKQFNDPTAEFLLIISLLAISALLADKAGLQPILGAFIAGVALNRRIPNLSPLMNRINFVGNAILIPIFLLSVGLNIDLGAFATQKNTLIIALILIGAKLSGKYIAASIARKIMNLTRTETQLLYSLTIASAAGTLAIATIATNSNIFDQSMLNAAVILILVSCLVAAIITEAAAKKISLNLQLSNTNTAPVNILIPIRAEESIKPLFDISFLTASKEANRTALHIITHPDQDDMSKNILNKAINYANAAEYQIQTITQQAANTANGIAKIIEEQHFNRIIMGMPNNPNLNYGAVIEQLKLNTDKQLLIYHYQQPINTIQKLRVAFAKNSTKEHGFMQCFEQIRQLQSQLGAKLVFYADQQTTQVIKQLSQQPHKQLSAVYKDMQNWEDILQIAKDIKPNDMFIPVIARKQTISYNPLFDNMPFLLNQFFKQYNYLVIYPTQEGTASNLNLMNDVANNTDKSLFAILRQVILKQMHKHQLS